MLHFLVDVEIVGDSTSCKSESSKNVENFDTCVSENLVEWLIFQLQLKISEVSIKN